MILNSMGLFMLMTYKSIFIKPEMDVKMFLLVLKLKNVCPKFFCAHANVA